MRLNAEIFTICVPVAVPILYDLNTLGVGRETPGIRRIDRHCGGRVVLVVPSAQDLPSFGVLSHLDLLPASSH